MFAEPHIWAICLQHSRSGAVIALSGIMHANSGAAVQQITRKATTMAAKRRMSVSLSWQCPGASDPNHTAV